MSTELRAYVDAFEINVYGTNNRVERERILGTRHRLFELVVEEVDRALGLPADAEGQEIRAQKLLVKSAIADALTATFGSM